MSRFPFPTNHLLTALRHSGRTVQAGTPMTVTGNGTLLRVSGQGVIIFCLKISRARWMVRHWFKNHPARGQRPGFVGKTAGRA